MTASWSAEDGRIAALLQQGLGQIHVISHEENSMIDAMDAVIEPYDDSDQEPEGNAVTYPELPDNPHNHTYTWSPKLPDGSMLVVRSQTPQGLVKAVEAMVPAAARLRMAWLAVTGTPPAPQAPVNQFPTQTPPPFGPNVSVPQAPGYQGPPAPQAPQWGGAPQAPQQQWGGQQAAQGERKEYPAPQGWMRMQGRKEQVDPIAQAAGVPKGNPNKGGMYNFFGLTPSGQPGKAWYCAPQVAQVFAPLNPMSV